ncbi:MAG: methyl-accepting chemotaxis protein, partial [Cognaticolwellia sp.]
MMKQQASGFSTLNINILFRLATLGIVACIALAVILFNVFKSDALQSIKQQSDEQIQRTAQMFMVSTVKFNQEFTSETNSEKKAEIHKNWIKTITAVDKAVTHNFGDDVSRIRLFTDERLLDLTSFGKSETAMQGEFETGSIERFSRGELDAIVSLDNDYYKIAIPLMSNMHDGCANCHSMPTTSAKVLGGLSVVTNIQAKMSQATSWAVKMSGLVFIILALVITVVYFFLYRNVTRPIAQLTENTQQMAEKLTHGKLGGWKTSVAKYEIAQLSSSIKTLHQVIQSTLQNIQQQANNVDFHSKSTQTIAEQAQNNIFTQQQSIDDMSQGIDGLTQVSCEVAERASHTASTTQEITLGITDGYEKMQKTLAAIQSLSENVNDANEVIADLSERSESIGGIVSTIDGIAEQTNLLALNAAIEAARAGEQGRGFAVVADEVRTLAQRTQTATSEINQLVSALQSGSQQANKVMKASREQASDTVSNATQASDSLQQVTSQLAMINELNAQITSATDQQTSTINVLMENIAGITTTSQEVLTGAEQTVNQTQKLAEVA